jgi:iron complex transport system permease protein
MSAGAPRHWRLPALGGLLLAVVTLAVLASLAVGSRNIPLGEVLAALFGGSDTDNATVITSQRLPRTLLGVVAGAALGAAGALMQGHTRNPLADPGLFGVNAGAGFAVAALVFVFGVSSAPAVVVAALAGAGAVSALVFLLGLGSLRGGALVMLAVIGTTVSALLSALTSSFVLLDRATLDVLRFWDVGSISNRDDQLTWLVLPLIGLGLLLSLLNGFSVNSLGLGADVAVALGTDIRRSRVVGITAITLLAGGATAVCGPITFLGLVAPHAARLLTGHDYRWLVPFAALVGAALLLVTDVLGRVVAPPGELQVGIVMAVVGGPVLLAITRRRRLVSL